MLNERKQFCRQIAAEARRSNNEATAKQWEEAAEEAASRFEMLTDFAEEDWKRPAGADDGKARVAAKGS